MKKDLCTIRKFITVLAAVTMLLATVLFMQVSVNANAETVNVTQNEEIYRELTNNDQLFGLDFTLDEYIANMRSEYYNQTMSEGDTYQRIYEHTAHMSKIIPIDLFKAPNTTYYLGVEYFFYIHTYIDSIDGLTSSVMLIDYDYEYSESTRSAKIRLAMLARKYVYFEENGQEVIFPELGINNDISLLNPEMFGVVNNKHSLNQYDAGYIKNQDPGIIFRQARLNYSGAYQEIDYSWQPVGSFVVGKVLGAVASWVNVSAAWDTIATTKEIIDALVSGIETTSIEVEADNEKNITDYYTKAAQIAEPRLSSLTKAIRVSPLQDTIINDCIELNVLLSEDVEPTELNLGAFFDLRINDPTTGSVEILSFGENSGHVIFSQTIYEEIYNYDEAKDSLYILPGDKQVLEFQAPFYTYYTFTHNFSDIKVFRDYDNAHFLGLTENIKKNSNYLINNNVPNYIEVYNETLIPQHGSISEVTVADLLAKGTNSVSIRADRSAFYKLDCGAHVVEIDTHDENITVEFYSNDYNLLQYINNGTEYITAKEVGNIYIAFVNRSGQEVTANITYTVGQTILREQNVQISGVQARYYRFIPDLTADYVLKTDSEDLEFSIKDEESASVYRLQEGKSYFIKVHNQSVHAIGFSIDFNSAELNVGRNNLVEKDIGIYKFVVPQDLRYNIAAQNQIEYVYINGVKQTIGETSVNGSFAANTVLYIVLNNISAVDTIVVSAAYDDEVIIGTEKILQADSCGYSIVKFRVGENSYYKIDVAEEYSLFMENLLPCANVNPIYLSSGIYYIKVSLEDGGNVVLKIEKVAQQINANQHYTIDETSYFVVDLIQNTEYILETLGDADKNVSTSIAIYDVNGMLVTSGNFLKFGRVTFNTGSNNKFNIIVGTNSNLTFVFRIVYASAEDINETVLTIDVCGYTTVANGSYMEFSTASSVELYVYVPNDLASIELYNVDGYVKLIPVVTEGNGYKKYLFQPAVATTYTIFIHLENAEYLPMVLLPANANSNIIVKDATEKIVNDLLNGNTYS